jgi:hypothetical protein
MDNMDSLKATRYSKKEWCKYKDEIIACHNQKSKTQAQIVQILRENGFYIFHMQNVLTLPSIALEPGFPASKLSTVRVIPKAAPEAKRSCSSACIVDPAVCSLV